MIDALDKEDRYDSLIRYYAGEIFPEIDWRLIKAQMWQESRMDRWALSPAGCMGLMQISEPLARERLAGPKIGERFAGFNRIWCPEDNIEIGVAYLKNQWDRFPEIPSPEEKLCFALASYNCGRGYVNAALRLARQAENSHALDHTPGKWQCWTYASEFLKDARCEVRGKRPDVDQVLGYVKHILRRFRHYRDLEEPYP